MLCLLLLTALTAGGCGGQEPKADSAQIELLEPLDDVSGWEAAAHRNIYDAKVYSAYVYPYTEEYTFDKGVIFGGFDAYWGQSVTEGGALAYADDSSLEENIRKKEEQIRDMEKEFQEYKEDTEKSLIEPLREVDRLEWIVEAYREAEPEEYLPVEENGSGNEGSTDVPSEPGTESAGNVGSEEGVPEAGSTPNTPGEPVKSSEYLKWEEEFRRFEGEYRILAHQIDTARMQLEQRTQLYELDREHALKELAMMKSELARGKLISSMSGTVAALGSQERGAYVGEKDKVIVIGDTDRKLLRCEYINKASVAKAKEVYALIDGIRREVEYQPMDAEEYARLSARDETVYSTFTFAEGAEKTADISAGDFAVIVLVNDSRENVLSVPENAIHTDASGTFVYVREEGETVAVNVETGMGDGVYREILSGLEEGTQVLAEETANLGEGRATVERGSFHSSFSGNGILVYPSTALVRNPVEQGRAYFGEYTVALYDHVEKGDVIASIRVQPDEVALKREQANQERLQERLALLESRGAEENVRAIAGIREELAEVRDRISDMEADYGTTQVLADKSGIIVNLSAFNPEDILEKDVWLAAVAEEDKCYVSLENKNQLLQYGNEVTVSYTDSDGKAGTIQGMVANLSRGGVSGSLVSEYSMILIPPEAIGNMPAVTVDESGWGRRNFYQVEGNIREMEQVLVVPKGAVREIGGKTYVYEVREDGSVVATAFIAGGYDDSRYWAVDGLKEGMVLCLK